MENLDLDINNYSINDVEKFFQLKPNGKYSASDIELKEYNIRETLLSTGHINKRFKQNLIEFLERAKQWLISVKCPPPKVPSTIPANYKLDPIESPALSAAASRQDELVTRPDTQFVYSNNSQYFPGKLNQLDTRVITKCLNIDTRFRDNLYSTHSSDIMLQLPVKLNKVVSMSLSSLELPVTFYSISSHYGNNFMYMSVAYTDASNNNILTAEKVVVVPDGNYNAQDLLDKINLLLAPVDTTGALANSDDMFSYIQLTLDITTTGSGTGKVTVKPSGLRAGRITNIIIDFTRDINGIPDNVEPSTRLGWNLGFLRRKYNEQTTYTADAVIDPAALRYIYLAVDDFCNSSHNHFINVFNDSIMNPNILARISVKGAYFSLLMENDFNIVTEPRTYFGPVDIQRLRIRLFDDRGRLLNMNNANYSFCLNLKMLYDL
jgi:hypothetical protein